MTRIRIKALAIVTAYVALVALLAYLASQRILMPNLLNKQMPEGIYTQAESAILYFIASLLLVASVLGASCILIFDRTIFSRLSRLEREVSLAENGAQPASRVTLLGSDELSSIAASFNWMLASLEDSQGKLQEAKQFTAIGETAAMVGHDLRNPLQTLTGAIYILKAKLAHTDDETVQTVLRHIENSVSYADKIVRDLLDYSKEPCLELTETKLQPILDQALELSAPPKTIRVHETIGTSRSIVIDVDKIKRVLVNIIKNAIDAMPCGGEISISCREEDNRVEISIGDTGSGISPEAMKNLWKPLRTTKSKGMGFGLPICKRFVEAHGGAIAVKTALGKGTIFTMQLPFTPVLTHSEQLQAPVPVAFNQFDIVL